MATPQKALMSGLPPRGSLSTPRTNKRTEDSPASGAPTKPPSARKQGSSASDNLRGIAINFNTLVDIEAMQSRKAAWGDGRAVIAVTPEQKRPQEKRRLADLDDQGVIRPIPLSFEPTSRTNRHGARIEASGDDQFLAAAAPAAAADVSSSIDSPDPCSKFHNGPGPISISPMTPGAPTSFVIDNGFERDAFSMIRKTLKQTGASSSSSDMPQIYGSNVSVDSPDPCSKFHSGPGPVAVSPLTPVGPTFSNTNKRSSEDNTSSSCPLIYGSNVSVDSPDVFSKYNKANAEAQQAAVLPPKTEVRRASVVEKAWRSSVMAEEAENQRSEKWRLSQPVASVSVVSAPVALTRKASSAAGTHLFSRAPTAVVSPDENATPDSFFSQTMSPLKPNYDRMIKTIAHAVESCPSPSPSSSSRFSRKASPAESFFKQTLSPFKADYKNKCEEINSPAGVRQPSSSTRVIPDFGSPQVEKLSFLPIKPCPPPPRPAAPAATSAAPKERPQPAFRRNFTGKDVSNTLVAPSPSSLTPAALSPSPNQQDDRENAMTTGGSGNLRRGRLLKQTTTATPPPPLLLDAEVEKEPQPARPQRALTVRVSYLQCEYQDGSKTKQAKKKKARLVRFEPLLETIPETFPALFASYPHWLESTISSVCAASLGSVRRITNDGIVVPRASSSSTEEEQAALLDTIAQHEELTQQLSCGGGASRLRKLLLDPLAASNSWTAKTDTYGLWLSKQCKPSRIDDPIFHLCFNGDVDGVQSFIKGNSDEDFSELRDSHGNTLLHLAAVSGSLKIVKVCLRLGIDANSSNNFGNCPLHFAEELGNPAVVDALIRRGGADPSIKNALDQIPGERVLD